MLSVHSTGCMPHLPHFSPETLLQSLLDFLEYLLALEHIEMCEVTRHFGEAMGLEDIQEYHVSISNPKLASIRSRTWNGHSHTACTHTFRSMCHQQHQHWIYTHLHTTYTHSSHTSISTCTRTFTTHTQHTVHEHSIDTCTCTCTCTCITTARFGYVAPI